MYPIRPIVCFLFALSTRQIHHIKPQLCASPASSITIPTARKLPSAAPPDASMACRSLRSQARTQDKPRSEAASDLASPVPEHLSKRWELLRSAAGYEDESLRCTAVSELVTLAKDSAQEGAAAGWELLKLFAKDECRAVRQCVADALSKFALAGAAPQHASAALKLLKQLSQDPDRAVRWHTAKALCGLIKDDSQHSRAALKLLVSLAREEEDSDDERSEEASSEEEDNDEGDELRPYRIPEPTPAVEALIESYYDADTQTLRLSKCARYKRLAGSDIRPILEKYKKEVRVIDLRNNRIDIQEATEMINFAHDHLPTLQKLNLATNAIAFTSSNAVEDDFVTAAESLVNKDGFNTLNLSNNDICMRWRGFVSRYGKAIRTALTSEKVLWLEWREEEMGERHFRRTASFI